MIFVIIGWVIFRSDNITNAFVFIKKMFTFNELTNISLFDNYYIKNGGIILLLGIVFVFPVISQLKKLNNFVYSKLNGSSLAKPYTIIVDVIISLTILAAFAASILICIKSTYNPFIYFNF